jgi:hypothetical protein
VKRIVLRSIPDPRFPNPDDPGYEANRVDYRLLIENAVRVPLNRETGASIEEMRKGVRILDALDQARDDVLSLEDADWEFLKQKVDKLPWAGTDRRFVQFYDDIMQATEAPRDGTRADGIAAT